MLKQAEKHIPVRIRIGLLILILRRGCTDGYGVAMRSHGSVDADNAKATSVYATMGTVFTQTGQKPKIILGHCRI